MRRTGGAGRMRPFVGLGGEGGEGKNVKFENLPVSHIFVTKALCTNIASDLLAIDLQLNVQIACDGLQQKFQHAEYSTFDPSTSQSILIRFLTIFTVILGIS